MQPYRTDWTQLDQVIEELPPGIPILPREDAGNIEKYANRPPRVFSAGECWRDCARLMERYDGALCKGYQEEMDTLLVFAGLFSAVVTAFIVESYQWLQEDASDKIILLLAQIAQSTSSNSSSISEALISSSSSLPRPVSIRINACWFLALSLALSAALFAMLCKQWVREFGRQTDRNPIDRVTIRQMHLSGLEYWKVDRIVSVLPLLLQLALALFALGILDLLWHLETTIAVLVCVPTLSAFVFYMLTTFLPSILHNLMTSTRSQFWKTIPECPYKSPQALLAFPLCDLVLGLWKQIAWAASSLMRVAQRVLFVKTGLFSPSSRVRYRPRFRVQQPSWDQLGLRFRWAFPDDLVPLARRRGEMPSSALVWLTRTLDGEDVMDSVWQGLWELATSSYPWELPDIWITEDIMHIARLRGLNCPDNLLEYAPWVAIVDVLIRRALPPAFIFEAFVQNVDRMDTAGVNYLFTECKLPAPAAISLVRAAAEYTGNHRHEDIGPFLLRISQIVTDLNSSLDLPLRRQLCKCTLALVLAWVRSHPPTPSVVHTTREVLFTHFLALASNVPEDFAAHPDRLGTLPHVPELATLLMYFSEMLSEQRVACESPTDAVIRELWLSLFFSDPAAAVVELMGLALFGVGSDACCDPVSTVSVSGLQAGAPRAVPMVQATSPFDQLFAPLQHTMERSMWPSGDGADNERRHAGIREPLLAELVETGAPLAPEEGYPFRLPEEGTADYEALLGVLLAAIDCGDLPGMEQPPADDYRWDFVGSPDSP